MVFRAPICAVVGHVDHGKTTLLDAIRGSAVASGEPGLITQHIGASFVPRSVIDARCGGLLKKYGFKIDVPGLLLLDTPGHEAFRSLRERGGSIADLAVLVVDVMQGPQPQTVEAVQILKANKTPFVIALTKIDLVEGWIPAKNACFGDSFESQRDFVRAALDDKIYGLVGKLADLGFDSDRFDRVKNPARQIVIVPVSAKTGEGLGELLLFLAGLAQRFMEKRLRVVDAESPAVGSVLEVKEVEGLGVTVDCIIYDGKIEQGDRVAVAGTEGVIITKVRAVLQPAPLEEIRDPKKKFRAVKKAYAAAGLKLAAPGLEKTIAGSPLLVVEDEAKARESIEKHLRGVLVETEKNGVIIRTDALGSLEALVSLFAKHKIVIRKAGVGGVTNRDVAEAAAVRTQNRFLGAVFAFNVNVPDEVRLEAAHSCVPVFDSNVVYYLQDAYEKWIKEEKQKEKQEQLCNFIYPAKFVVMPDCLFHMSKPAIVGVTVLAGIIVPKQPIMNEEGEVIGRIQSIQEQNHGLEKAEKGAQVAVSIDDAVVGRDVNENDVLYSSVPLNQIEALEKNFEDKKLLEEIKAIIEKRK